MDGYGRCDNSVIDQIGTEAFLRGCKDKDSARHVIERNPETINKALKQLKTSIANQKAIYGSKSDNCAHRQVSFADSAVSPTDKGNVCSPLENEMRNLTQIVTKLADVMLSTDQRYRGLTDQYNRGNSDQYNRGRSPDQYTRGRSPDQYTRGRSPDQYNCGRSPDRNTSKFNSYRQETPPPRQRSYSPQGQRSASPGTNSRNPGYFKQRSPSPKYRANQSVTPTTESLNSNGSGQ
ncbi:unnamed protein product [Mytilus coruscus]|uniref:Uncharacterized protein n=1 Tax=Mytilus coruscus TaxID=42192 RepID=A0A6J8AZX7_MYTCO|nr:unnamed protein product [Mytilus coruscus]